MTAERVNFGDTAPFGELLPAPFMGSRFAGLVALNPDVLIRPVYCFPSDGASVTETVNTFGSHLNDLRDQHGIPHALLGFVIGRATREITDSMGTEGPIPYAVVRHVKDAVPFNEIASSDTPNVDAVNEYDYLSQRMFKALVKSYRAGGLFNHEITSLEQFVYSPTAEAGKRTIFVDVEPVTLERFDGYDGDKKEIEFLNAGMYLVADLMRLQSRTKTSLEALTVISSTLAEIFKNSDDAKNLPSAHIDSILNDAEQPGDLSSERIAILTQYCIAKNNIAYHERLQNIIVDRSFDN